MMLIMRKKRYRSKRNNNNIKIDKTFLGLMALFIAGTIIGALAYHFLGNNSAEYIDKTAWSYIVLRQTQSKKDIFISVFMPNAVIVFVAFICNKISVFSPVIPMIPFFQGLGFGCFSVAMIKYIEENIVMLFAFTVLQEKFWTILVLNLILTYIIKTDVCNYNHRYGDGRRLSEQNTVAIIILSMLLMGAASALSTLIVSRFGVSLIRGVR